VNGKLTLGENIGDLTGIAIAYRAYLKSLGGKEAPVPRRFHRTPALLHRLRPGVALPVSGGSDAPAGALEPSLAAGVSRERSTAELSGVLRSLRREEGDGMWLPPGEGVKIW
jgi:hypothetical protein